jgi:hypothetical protein
MDALHGDEGKKGAKSRACEKAAQYVAKLKNGAPFAI